MNTENEKKTTGCVEIDPSYLFAQKYLSLSYADLPAEVVMAAKKSVLDILATSLGGSTKPGISELFDISTEWGGSRQSSVIAHGIKLPTPVAAQLNATMAHALDYDDVHEFAIMHPGTIVVPTAFAMAEYVNHVTGKELLTAIVLGTDLLCRISLAHQPDISKMETGWHYTSLYGALAAALISGLMLKLSEEQMVNALGIAYHQSAGNMQCVIDGALTKRMGPGFAVRAGIVSSLLAKKGVTGSVHVFQGQYGMYNLYHNGCFDSSQLTKDIGKHFEQRHVVIKPYPACRSTHAFIDAALFLRQNHVINPDKIKKITIYTGSGCYAMLATPLETKCRPRNSVDTQFSIPWVVAIAISKGKPSLEDFTEVAINNQKTLHISSKITVELDKTLERPHTIEAGRVTIEMVTGEVYEKQVDSALGSYDHPLSFDACAQKFIECSHYSTHVISDDKASEVIDQVRHIEDLDNVAQIMDLVR